MNFKIENGVPTCDIGEIPVETNETLLNLLGVRKVNALKACAHCNTEACRLVKPAIGVPSGDNGYLAIISCANRECGVKVQRWALKRKWAIDSANKAWNTRATPDIDKVIADFIASDEFDERVKEKMEGLGYGKQD